MTRTIQPGQAYITPHHLAAQARQHHRARRDTHRAMQAARSEAPEQPRPLRREALATLLRNGHLPPESARAGREIAEVFYAIIGGIRGRVTAQYGERIPGGPAEDWAPRMRTAYAERYAPWSDWAGRQAAGRGTLAGLTLLVAADNLGLRQTAQKLHMDQRTVLTRLQDSLWWYAETANWVQHPIHAMEARIGA